MRVLFPLLLVFLFTSCVSKKKHSEAIKILKMEHQSILSTEVNAYKKELNSSKDTVFQLRLKLAERKGENNILSALAEKMEARVKVLESEIDDVGSQSVSSQKNLNTIVNEKEDEIQRLNGLLRNVDAMLDQHVSIFQILAGELQEIVLSNNDQDYMIRQGQDQLRFTLNENLLFKKGRTTTQSDGGFILLEKFSTIMATYPNMNVQVIGHTDNSTPSKTYKHNWNVSVLRAAIIVRSLIDDFDMNANQLLAAGKGEFAPFTSNETSEGRTQNRRIEFIINPRSEELVNSIRQILEQ